MPCRDRRTEVEEFREQLIDASQQTLSMSGLETMSARFSLKKDPKTSQEWIQGKGGAGNTRGLVGRVQGIESCGRGCGCGVAEQNMASWQGVSLGDDRMLRQAGRQAGGSAWHRHGTCSAPHEIPDPRSSSALLLLVSVAFVGTHSLIPDRSIE